MSKNRNAHLDCVLRSHNIENNESLMEAYRTKRDEVRTALENKYGSRIYRILHSGSYKKRTAINIKFDMDLVVPFKKGEAETLKSLFQEILAFFNEYRKDDETLIEVKAQKIAIGLTFLVDGQLLDLDIVPGREVGDYEEDGELNVHVNNTMGVFEKDSRIKTNIQKQIDNIRDNSDARDPIKLLKVWKRRNNGQIKSFVIELITIKALDGYKGDKDKWSVLKHILAYIRDNIKTVRLVDPGNSNNVVSDSLDEFQKSAIESHMKYMLEQLEASEDLIETYFPANPDFPCPKDEQDDKRSIYVVGGTKKSDRLNNEDFG